MSKVWQNLTKKKTKLANLVELALEKPENEKTKSQFFC
jgi:hypothetical protein